MMSHHLETKFSQTRKYSRHLETLPPTPDPQITLPLLVGLSRRPQSSQKIVNEALLQFRSSISIGRWLLRTCSRNRNSKSHPNRNDSFTNPEPFPSFPTPCHRLHWIFRCLFSPSIRVRQYASIVLLEGWNASRHDDNSNESQTNLLFQVLHYLLDLSLDFDVPFSIRSLAYAERTEGGDHTIQLFGLLIFLLSGSGGENGGFQDSLAKNEGKKSTSSGGTLKPPIGTNFNNRKRKAETLTRSKADDTHTSILPPFTSSSNFKKNASIKSGRDRKRKSGTRQKGTGGISSSITSPSQVPFSIKCFIASGGLRWLARRALLLVTHLVSSNSGALGENFGVRSHTNLSEISHEAIYMRLTLLIDLCQLLLTHDTKETQKSDPKNLVYSLFWTSNIPALFVQNVPLTPLAVFICIHEIIKNKNSGQAPSHSVSNSFLSTKGVDKTVSTISRIIDPTSDHAQFQLINPTNSSFLRALPKVSTSRLRPPPKKRIMDFTTSRTKPSTSSGDRESSSLETLPTNSSLSFSFGRSTNDKGSASETVAAAVNAAISGVEQGMEDIEEVQSEEEEEEEEQCEEENSDNNEDHEELEDAIIILEDGNDSIHADEEDEEDPDEEEAAKESEEENQSENDENAHDEDVVLEQLAEDAIHQENSSSHDMDFDLVNMGEEEESRKKFSSSASTVRSKSSKTKSFNNFGATSNTFSLDRKEAYLQAAMQVLESQHLSSHHASINDGRHSFLSPKGNEGHHISKPLLSPSSERSLLQSMCDIIKPPPKPLNLKICMRRAPTQEEFFRGSLSKNPISLSSLSSSSFKTPTTEGNSGDEPTFKDLRKHIANDLQMSDSAELLELLVAGKIISMSLKVRVVQQVLWRRYVLDNASNSNDFSFSTAPGYTSDTETSSLPAMIVTYRLAGVDGEATEDKIEENDITDPLASSTNDNSETVEKEFRVTKIIAEGRGIAVVLRSIEVDIGDILRKIRRDNVMKRKIVEGNKNPSQEEFVRSRVGPGLVLLRHCARIKDNRRKMVTARAPSLLLRLLLDVLNAIDNGPRISSKEQNEASSIEAMSNEQTNASAPSAPSSSERQDGNNPTAIALQELIEILASDISGNTESETVSKDSDEKETEDLEDVSLPLLLNSLKECCLSAAFRLVIANLLPFLTYGQKSLSRTLALEFVEHVNFDLLDEKENASPLMMTFVDAAINLPAVEVCNTLRLQLLAQGFVTKVINFIMETVPNEPPSWSPALFSKKIPENLRKNDIQNRWRIYLTRAGLQKAFKILIGLSNKHSLTQCSIARVPNVLKTCHWIENTSDTAAGIDLGGIGLLAETLLDTLKVYNDEVSDLVEHLRKATKHRKKEIAEERRNRALTVNGSSQPSWLAEMEAMKDEVGLTCAVCREGVTFKPTELLGLYSFVKKVSIPQNKGGSKASIDGTHLFLSLPSNLPDVLAGTEVEETFFCFAKATAKKLSSSSSSSEHGSSSISSTLFSSRPSHFITTVSAGTAIHCSCHARARQTERNHPKAPKSEWEGAALRNSRVKCNIILPLVTSNSLQVPLVAVESGLADFQSAVINTIGGRPKSMLWTVLHDVRLLILRIAYGESLNADCGGGSLASNASLVFYLLCMAKMYSKHAEHGTPTIAQHAKYLSAAFISACEILRVKDMPSLLKHLADSAPMAGICSVIEIAESIPYENRQWNCYKHHFLIGLIYCAGRRKACGIEDSGCISGRSTGKRMRSSSIAEWEIGDSEDSSDEQNRNKYRSSHGVRNDLSTFNIEDHVEALRPMITLFAILNTISSEFDPNMNDEKVTKSAEKLTQKVAKCQRTKNIKELLREAGIKLECNEIIAEFEKGLKLF